MKKWTKEELKVKAEAAWTKMKGGAQKGWQWCQDNKEFVTVLGPVVIGSTIEVIKIVARKGNLNEERRLKDLYVYDRSAGHYYELRRKPKQSEWLKIDELKRQGVPLSVILQDLRILK